MNSHSSTIFLLHDLTVSELNGSDVTLTDALPLLASLAEHERKSQPRSRMPFLEESSAAGSGGLQFPAPVPGWGAKEKRRGFGWRGWMSAPISSNIYFFHGSSVDAAPPRLLWMLFDGRGHI